MTDSNWGRWGAEDQRGALNLITADKVRAAAARRRTGKVYSLAIPLTQGSIPAIHDRPNPERYTLSSLADAGRVPEFMNVPAGVGSNEDVLVVASHNGTHMDALCHVVADSQLYNGFPADTFTPRGGAARCGIEHNGTFAGPAKLLDVAGFVGGEGLAFGQIIDADLLEACRAAQATEIEAGDILLIRTGWIERQRAGTLGTSWEQPGIGRSAARWIVEHDIAAVGSDNSAVESIPFDEWQYLTVHIELLQKRGVTLMEHLWLAELAADKAYDLLLAVGGLPVTGATGSPINPIAIG